MIVSYEDRPHNYDAWDVNNYYTEKSWDIDQVSAMEVVENGFRVRACVKVERKYLDSTITQFIYLYHDIPRIDIKNVIDWKRASDLCKDYFPIDVHTNEATFDIQYGNVKTIPMTILPGILQNLKFATINGWMCLRMATVSVC